MRILISGASGTIGRELAPALVSSGHELTRLKTGRTSAPDQIPWAPLRAPDPAAVSGYNAIIHLAGENVFGRWSAAKKRTIYESRVIGTRNLCAALAQSARKPRVLLGASAIGFYGAQRGNEILTEDSTAGNDFLATLCRDWEAATLPAKQAGIRVVNLRFGLVLTPRGGVLKKILPPFRAGLGGPMGSGNQYMSWISIADLIAAVMHCLREPAPSGPVNLTAPNPVTNAEFAKTLAQILHRPAWFRVPEFVLKLVMGDEMARSTVLASQRVLPKKLEASGYRFQAPELMGAFAGLLQSAA